MFLIIQSSEKTLYALNEIRDKESGIFSDLN